MAERGKKITVICANRSCEKEVTFIPSRRQKYCSVFCYQNDPEVRKRKRVALSHFFKK